MIRFASAVILVRGSASTLEVFLVERSPKLRFLGGYHAFPGGVLAPEDRGDLERCARRELFEETGVLIGERAAEIEHQGRDSVRTALLQEELGVGDGSAQPAVERLIEAAGPARLEAICRLITPPFAPVRYDTRFYLSRQAPGDREPQVVVGELKGGNFWRPDQALEAWRQGSLLVAPPVLALLEILAEFGLDYLAREAERRAGGIEDGLLPAVRFSPGVVLATQLTDTIPPATTTNCCIVGQAKLFVIDPAVADRDGQEQLLRLIDSLSEQDGRVEAVLLTHHHQDHVGAAARVASRYAVPVMGHPLTLERLDFDQTAPLKDGDALDLGRSPDGRPDWSLRAIHTPGHARGHLCYQENRHHALVAGDMLSTLSTIVIDPPEGHLATYLDSLDRLLEQDIGTLYPGHGPPAASGRRVVSRYIEHRQARERQLLAALSAGERSVEQLLERVYADTPGELWPYATRSLRAGLEKLEEESRVRRVGTRWLLAEN